MAGDGRQKPDDRPSEEKSEAMIVSRAAAAAFPRPVVAPPNQRESLHEREEVAGLRVFPERVADGGGISERVSVRRASGKSA